MTSFPHFLCIGAQKAGTTWLYGMLKQNPSVWLPPIKEIHFFDSLDISPGERENRLAELTRKAAVERAAAQAGGQIVPTARESFILDQITPDILSMPWYQRIYGRAEAAGKITGDFTPSYSVLDLAMIRTIKATMPDIKIILLVRDPVDRALSQMRMMIERSGVILDDKKAWRAMIDKIDLQNRGNYASFIPKWRSVFDDRSLRIYPFGDIRANPARLLADIERFVGALPHDAYTEIDRPAFRSADTQIPAWVISKLQSAHRHQTQYLEREFGRDFVSRIR